MKYVFPDHRLFNEGKTAVFLLMWTNSLDLLASILYTAGYVIWNSVTDISWSRKQTNINCLILQCIPVIKAFWLNSDLLSRSRNYFVMTVIFFLVYYMYFWLWVSGAEFFMKSMHMHGKMYPVMMSLEQICDNVNFFSHFFSSNSSLAVIVQLYFCILYVEENLFSDEVFFGTK